VKLYKVQVNKYIKGIHDEAAGIVWGKKFQSWENLKVFLFSTKLLPIWGAISRALVEILKCLFRNQETMEDQRLNKTFEERKVYIVIWRFSWWKLRLLVSNPDFWYIQVILSSSASINIDPSLSSTNRYWISSWNFQLRPRDTQNITKDFSLNFYIHCHNDESDNPDENKSLWEVHTQNACRLDKEPNSGGRRYWWMFSSGVWIAILVLEQLLLLLFSIS
jgi:hypothetical protein